MSLQAKILSLLSGVVGADNRLGVASTIIYLCNLYFDGKIDDETFKRELRNIAFDVITATHPELLEEEAREEANKLADEIYKSARLEGLRRRILSTYGLRYMRGEL
ncbi:MAG: hypothetical protein ACXQTI_06755 [Candidatus Nezhaarchaeales archaeon]